MDKNKIIQTYKQAELQFKNVCYLRNRDPYLKELELDTENVATLNRKTTFSQVINARCQFNLSQVHIYYFRQAYASIRELEKFSRSDSSVE